jgi:hypothetical protein
MRSTTQRYLRASGLAAMILCAVLVGTALAKSANSMRLIVPAHAKVNQKYSVTVKGHVAKKETLYLFIDYYKCGRTPYAEHVLHAANGDYWSLKAGKFTARSPGWRSPRKAPYHACAYLVKASAPLNPRHGVIARKFKTFRVH